MDIKHLIFQKFKTYMVRNMLPMLLLLIVTVPVCLFFYNNQIDSVVSSQRTTLNACTGTVNNQISMYLSMLESSFMQKEIQVFAQTAKLKPENYKEITKIKSSISSICNSDDFLMDAFVFFENNDVIITNYGAFTQVGSLSSKNSFLSYYSFDDGFTERLRNPQQRSTLLCSPSMTVSCLGWSGAKKAAFTVERQMFSNIRVYLLFDQTALMKQFGTIDGELLLFDAKENELDCLFESSSLTYSASDRFCVSSTGYTYINTYLCIDRNTYSATLQSAFLTIILFTSLIVVSGIIISAVSSYCFCKPLYRVLQKFKEINPNYNSQEEAFRYLLSSAEQLHNRSIQAADQLSSIKSEMTASIIDRYLYTPVSTETRSQACLENFPLNYFVGYAIISPETDQSNNQDFSLLLSTIRSQLSDDLYAISHIIDYNSFILIVPSTEEEFENQIDFLKKKTDIISRTFSISISMSISHINYSINRLSNAYEESRSVMFTCSSIPGVHFIDRQDSGRNVSRYDSRKLYDAVLQDDYPLAYDILNELMSDRYGFISFEQRFRYARTLIILAAGTFMPQDRIPHISYVSSNSPQELFRQLCEFAESVCLESRRFKQSSDEDQNLPLVLNRTVIDYINDHYIDDNLSNQMICTECGISEKTLNEICRETTGMNASVFIHQLRMDKAASLLRNTDTKVIDILKSCGYNTPNAFYKAFKLYYGKSPSDYRNEYKNKQI